MEITGANTNGLTWHEIKKGLPPEEIDWLNKMSDETPIEELISYNPAISIILTMITEIKNDTTKPEGDQVLESYECLLKKEKIFALIKKEEKTKN